VPSEEGKGVDTQIRSLGDLIKQQQPPPPTAVEKPPAMVPVFNGPLYFTQQIENATKPACGCSGEPTYNQGISIAVKEPCPKCEKVGMYPGIVQDAGTKTVFLHNGEFSHYTVDLEIPGRGFNWKLERKYRSGVIFNGPLGHGWEFNYNRRLFAEANGSVIRMDGLGRADRYELVGGSYSAPAGFYTRLVRNPDGTFTERDMSGIKAFYSRPDAQGIARLTGLWDRNGNRMRFEYNGEAQLVRVLDTLGRPIVYRYNSERRLAEVEDFVGRKVRFQYDPNGDLVAMTSPAVSGTPNGNDFSAGKTTRYRYSSRFSDPRLNHNLLEIVAPNEVATGGPPYIKVAYDTTPSSPSVGRVLRQTIGGVNASGVPAGGTISYEYRALGTSAPNDFASPVTQTTVVNRNGNRTEYQFNRIGNIVRIRKFANRKIRPGDPEFYETRYEYNKDGEMIRMIFPEGNSSEYVYDGRNPDRFQQGNLLAEILRPDPRRGGDQQFAKTSYTYEPIFNQTRTVTEARGNDPSYVPQNGGANNPARYTTTYVFDYQEGQNYASLANELGVSENVVRQLLGAANIPMGLGDVNGDGLTDQIAGNMVKVVYPHVNLLPGFNMARIEGGPQQSIIRLSSHNRVGQVTKTVDPEGNIDLYDYYPENDPSGDGKNVTLGVGTNPFGYLKQITRDAVSAPVRNSGTNPTPTSIRHLYQYDRVGNVIREVDGRGIATDYAVNQLNQITQIARASGHNVFAPKVPEPLPLTDFKYLERISYDFNNNIVRRQIEDRGNTSNVGANNANSGTAFVDYERWYDILDRQVEMRQEASDKEWLITRFRYDPNGNKVLTIQAEGNAVASLYDERDLLYQQTRGAIKPPSVALLGASDPTQYDVRGGQPSTTSYKYDLNGNQTETLDGLRHRNRAIYDGFDRRMSVVDGVGNQMVTQYDPIGNVVRVSRFGPVGGPSPTSDGPAVLLLPVSSIGVIQAAHLVTTNLLEATESLYDELSRMFQTDGVLFVNTIPTMRPSNVADGAGDIGKGNLTPGDNQAIPGISGIKIIGRVTTRTEFDRKGRRTFTVRDDGDTSRNFYDGVDRVIKTVDPEGNTLEMAYDANDNVIERRETDVGQESSIPNEVFITTVFYDSLDRMQRSVDNLGQTFDYRYDSRSNLVAMADAQGLLGPPIVRRAFKGGPLTNNSTNRFGNVTRYFYDGINRKVREETILTASGHGDGVNAGADIFGVKTAAPTPDSKQGGGDGLITVRYAWDRNFLMTSLTDDNGNQTQYTYDNLNRRLTETKGNCVPPKLADRCSTPTTIRYQYDSNNNIIFLVDENGSITECQFDPINRRTTCQVTRAPGVVGSTVTSYEYDGLSRLTRATDNNDPSDVNDDSTITFAYDSLSRVIEETQQTGYLPRKAISSAWRARDLRSSLTYPNDRMLDFTYDRLDRPKTISDHGAPQPIADYNYIGPSRVAQRSYPINNTRMTYLDNAGKADVGYDGLRRPAQLRHLRADASLVIGFTHIYDRMDNKRTEEKLHAPGNSELYGYDSAYRLVRFDRGTLSATKDAVTVPSRNKPVHSRWVMDGPGNWKQVDAEARQHSSFNAIISRDGANVPSDKNGNVTDNGTFAFKWDYQNRLRMVSRKTDSAVIAVYSYDAFGRRTRKVVANTLRLNGITDFYFDGWQEIEERNAADGLSQQYVYGFYLNEPLVLDRNPRKADMTSGAGEQRLFFHTNMLGSVLALTDKAGGIVEGYQYDAYGRPTVYRPDRNGIVNFDHDEVVADSASAVGNPYLYTGGRFDPESGLYYFRTRYLDPLQGRFISRDSIGIWGDRIGLGNGYAYVGNNPSTLIDSFGLQGKTVEKSPAQEGCKWYGMGEPVCVTIPGSKQYGVGKARAATYRIKLEWSKEGSITVKSTQKGGATLPGGGGVEVAVEEAFKQALKAAGEMIVNFTAYDIPITWKVRCTQMVREWCWKEYLIRKCKLGHVNEEEYGKVLAPTDNIKSNWWDEDRKGGEVSLWWEQKTIIINPKDPTEAKYGETKLRKAMAVSGSIFRQIVELSEPEGMASLPK
jgi:RHS repeat-associated protein